MTYEELKLEAEKQGYTLTKKITYEKIKPCICGNKRIYSGIDEFTFFKGKFGRFYYCSKSRRKGEIAKYLYQAKRNWNEMIEKANENIQKYNPKCSGGNVRPIRAKEQKNEE